MIIHTVIYYDEFNTYNDDEITALYQIFAKYNVKDDIS